MNSKENFIILPHVDYFSTALFHFEKMKILKERCDREKIKLDINLNSSDDSETLPYSALLRLIPYEKDFHNFFIEARMFYNIVTIFCAATVESYINTYGILKSPSKSYFKNHLDKLELKNKWILIPKIITGKNIPPESRSLELLTKLIKLRNTLVHDKPKSYQIEVGLNDGKNCIDTVYFLSKELAAIDKTEDISWLNFSKEIAKRMLETI